MGTAISCTDCSQVATLSQMVGRSSLKAPSVHAAVLCAAVFCSKIVVIVIIRCKHVCVCVHTKAMEVLEVLMARHHTTCSHLPHNALYSSSNACDFD